MLRRDGGVTRAVEYAETTLFAGPLPAPDLLCEYDRVLPGAAERIIAMSEREAGHRHSVEMRMLGIHGRNSTLGICSGLLVGLAAIVGGVVAVVRGADLAGSGVALTGLAALVGVFVVQRRRALRQLAAEETEEGAGEEKGTGRPPRGRRPVSGVEERPAAQ